VARNRKRAKDRRTRRPTPPADSRQGLPTATHELEEGVERNGVPDVRDPLAHAAPDAELANAQLAFGRPDEPEPGDEADEEEYELEVEGSIADDEVEEPLEDGEGGVRDVEDWDGDGDGSSSGGGRQVAAHRGAVGEPRTFVGTRLFGFLQGSWRELQRVQWPDRRQVMQATGVVIGFVIVAAVFLGVADEVAGKLVSFVLK
jgi:preprotein translocase subunit SecE